MENKFIMINLEDKESKKIAEVLSNKTCKKIINYLSEIKETSEKELSDILEIPLNTVEYNLKKLLKIGLVEKTNNFFWSTKGKKIQMYKMAKKHIIIFTKSEKISSKIKSILPAVLISGIFAVLIRNYYLTKSYLSEKSIIFQDSGANFATEPVIRESQNIAIDNSNIFFTQPDLIWIWFLSGALIAIFIFTILNWKKI
jgi:DNA-binding transcriptional ArsR family regulator